MNIAFNERYALTLFRGRRIFFQKCLAIFFPKMSGNRGAVLFLVLILLAGLATLSVQFSRDTLLDKSMSSAEKSVLAAKPLLESGEMLAAYLLVKNFGVPSDHTSQQFSLLLQSLSKELHSGELEGHIEDENSFFPINAIFYRKSTEKDQADRYAVLLSRMLAWIMVQHGYKNAESALTSAEEFVASLRQWGGNAPLDEISRHWYLEQNPPCLPPGRPLCSPEEILLVRWPNIEKKLAKQFLLGTKDIPGLLDSCSLWNRGPLNCNTIRPAVIASLMSDLTQSRSFVDAVLKARQEAIKNNDSQWYEKIFSEWGVVSPGSDILAWRSRWFRVFLSTGQGVRKNTLLTVGWVTNSSMIREYREIR